MRGVFGACLAASVAVAGSAGAAESSIIKNAGDHPAYSVDLEPHVIFGFGNFGKDAGVPGVGVQGTFIIVQDGFIKSINNNVGIGVGANFFFADTVVVGIPVVMQWNFFLSTHWSVFGEPGVGIAAANKAVLYPIFAAGGRYHFTERIALTMRAGYPWIAVGVSFFF
jgi:hypothetical protein